MLFGDANPSGKLPVTFPRSNAQGPADPTRETLHYPGNGSDVHYDEGLLVGYRWYDATGQHPLFPFGFGLSYTTFQFSGLKVRPSSETASALDDSDHPRSSGWTVTARVTNTGTRAGAQVAQLYIGAPAGAHEPVRQLKAYTKVTLKPGQTKTVRLELPRSALASWNNSDTGWTVAKGRYQIYVGDSSRNLPPPGRIFRLTEQPGTRSLARPGTDPVTRTRVGAPRPRLTPSEPAGSARCAGIDF